MKYKLIQNSDRIFSLEFENSYDLAMCFLRVQEFYESPNKNFRGNSFNVFEYMDWYSKKHSSEGCFTYPKDWAGFNVSSEQINKCYLDLLKEHRTVYDEFFEWEINNYIFKEIVNQEKYYLIGYVKNKKDNSVFEHEIAHAFYFLDKDYKKLMLENIKLWNVNFKNKVFEVLRKTGYVKGVFEDETQAYFSTDESYILENIKSTVLDKTVNLRLMKNIFQFYKSQILYKKPIVLKQEDFNLYE